MNKVIFDLHTILKGRISFNEMFLLIDKRARRYGIELNMNWSFRDNIKSVMEEYDMDEDVEMIIQLLYSAAVTQERALGLKSKISI